MKRATLLAATLLACLSTSAHAGPLTLDSVIALSQSGIGDDAIVAKIRSTSTHIDLSVDQMMALKTKGVSGPVLAALLTSPQGSQAPTMTVDSPNPADLHPAGVYMLDGSTSKMRRIDPTVSNQAKTGGIWGYALTGGIASMSVKAAIQGGTARVHATEHRPTFYFFFDESNPQVGPTTTSWAAGTSATVTAPSEFTLIHLEAKSGRREARVGSMNIGGAKTGVMDKDRLAFDYELVRPGVFKVQPKTDLVPGEYGFIYALSGGNVGGAVSARIFDFSV
jgi:hypothetical protein